MARIDPRRAIRRVSVQVAVFLSLALLPLGLLAVMQTREVVRQAEARSAASLGALAERAAEIERQRIERAFGAAQGLGLVALSVSGDRPRCDAVFRSFVDTNPSVHAAGFARPDGRRECAHPPAPGIAPVGPPPDDPASRRIEIRRSTPPAAGREMIVVQPIVAHGTLQGHVRLALAYTGIEGIAAGAPDGAVPDLVTFDRSGRVLSLSEGAGARDAVLPAAPPLAEMTGQGSRVFTARSRAGPARQFAVTAVVPDALYVLASWEKRAAGLGAAAGIAPAPLFPLLMWAVSLAVAFLAVNRLMIRHVRALQRFMRQFARSRQMPGEAFGRAMPAELAEIAATFRIMADTVIRDEAELERTLHDKDVLLREVHHRVKNNLQLVSSIMNMKSRRLRSEEGRTVLRRLQERVQSLAAIHRNLYDTGNLSAVDARTLIEDLVRQIAALGADGGAEGGAEAEIERDIAELRLHPDQAVPLSLLAAEALTNAFKHLGRPSDAAPRVRIRLAPCADGRLELEVANSLPAEGRAEAAEPGLGLGLIRAFAGQLSGTLETGPEDGLYVLRCRFRPRSPGPPDAPHSGAMDSRARLG